MGTEGAGAGFEHLFLFGYPEQYSSKYLEYTMGERSEPDSLTTEPASKQGVKGGDECFVVGIPTLQTPHITRV